MASECEHCETLRELRRYDAEVVTELKRQRDEARALVIRAVYPHERDSWGILMRDMEAQPWVRAAIDGKETSDGGE